jgi:predicted ATPase
VGVATELDGLGGWVREWRHCNRWTQEQLGEALGYDVSYVAKIERGRRPASNQFVARLAEVVGVPQAELLQLCRRPSARVRLPVPVTQVVGRASEVSLVSDVLRGPTRLLTLVGAPGIGKTTLALEVAWHLAPELRDGACFVPLAEVSEPAGVAVAVVHRLGLVEHPGRDLEDVVVGALRNRFALLVLDNFEHVLGARALVARLVEEAPRLRVLVTSREALGLPDEAPYPVPRLAFPDPAADRLEGAAGYPAVEVFVARSRAARPDFTLTETNTRPVVEICARLDGLPLAISLTAAASRILSPADIARSLAARLELPADGAVDPFAHRRLTAALDWSWQLLEPGEQALLARLGVFSGGCTLTAVESVCSADGDEDVLAGLAALESKSLVEAGQGGGGLSRFRILETVRRYALHRLREQGRVEEFQARHCAYFVDVAEAGEPHLTGGPEQGLWFRLLDEDYANLSAAFEWSLAHRPSDALRLSGALWRFFSIRRISDGRRWLEAALDRAAGPGPWRLRALNGFAVLARSQGELERAMAALAEARVLAAETGATRELALAILNEGIIEEQRAVYDVAESRFSEALVLYRQVGDDRGVGHALNCLGVIALRRHDTDTASGRFLDALARFRRLQDRWSSAVSATNLGWIAEMAGQWLEAREWYEESRQIWESVGDEHGLGRSLAALGRIARRRRDLGPAGELMEDALHVFHRLGDRRLAAACLLELAAIAAERRRGDLAARLLGAADGVRESLGTPAWSDEEVLEEQVMGDLRKLSGEAATRRARTIGRALPLEEAIELVEWGTWPPAVRRWPA